MTIVYESATGFTKQYAQLLAGQTGLPLLSRKEAEQTLEPGARILYLGWLCAGHIKGLEKMAKRCRVEAACGVGLTPPSQMVLEDLARHNQLGLLFYLHGGYAPAQLTGPKKWTMAAVTKAMRKKYSAQTQPDEESVRFLSALANGGSFVRAANLRPVLDWLDQRCAR